MTLIIFSRSGQQKGGRRGKCRRDIELDMMDETTNSVLRISPIRGRNELQPKIVIIPREDLWKVRHLDEQILGGKQGGRTPDINIIARVITENNLTGTAQLTDSGISIDGTLSRPGWEEAVKEGKLVELFQAGVGPRKSERQFHRRRVSRCHG